MVKFFTYFTRQSFIHEILFVTSQYRHCEPPEPGADGGVAIHVFKKHPLSVLRATTKSGLPRLLAFFSQSSPSFALRATEDSMLKKAEARNDDQRKNDPKKIIFLSLGASHV